MYGIIMKHVDIERHDSVLLHGLNIELTEVNMKVILETMLQHDREQVIQRTCDIKLLELFLHGWFLIVFVLLVFLLLINSLLFTLVVLFKLSDKI